jgi:succinate dehydrogenase/fumarate reductase flavoprotein subunit
LAEKNGADIEISTLKVQITEINEQKDIYLTRIEDFNRDIEPKNFRLNDLEEILKVTKTKLQSSQQKEVSLFKTNNQLEIKNSELKRLNDDNIERKDFEVEKRKTDLAFIAELESLLEQAKELRLETELKYGKSENL